MNNLLPTEHLSPIQMMAYTSLKSGKSVEVRSKGIRELIEIINISLNVKKIVIQCNPHTFKLLQDYKDRHSHDDMTIEAKKMAERYHQAIVQLENTYRNCYPINASTIRHQYLSKLSSYGLSIDNAFNLDARLKGKSFNVSSYSFDILDLLSSYKKTWVKFKAIDPMQDSFYSLSSAEPLLHQLDEWINTVKGLYAEMQNGLNEIVDEEKSRILSIKKELTQHLVNYQHSQSDGELDQMRQKIGFLRADLTKESFDQLPQLVMFVVSNWEQATSKYLSRYSRRFNSRNHQSIEIYEAMQELRFVLRNIDENGCIKVDISNTPLSYEKQIIQVESLLDQLQFCKHWISDESDYIEWLKFYTTISVENKSVVDILLTMDKDDLPRQLNNIEIQKWKDSLLNKGIPSTDDSLALFGAYKDLSATINWTNVELTTATSSTGYSYSLSFDGDHYILSTPSDAKDTNSFTIIDKSLDSIKATVTLDYYSQSQQATHLANAIISAKAKIRTFQTKSLNIISCLDDKDSDELLRLLAVSKINELKGESLLDLIKGSILDEGKEKIVLIYDDLLNVDQLEHYIWQRHVLQSMSSAGYTVVSINTEDCFNHIDLSKLLSVYLKSSDSKNVLYNTTS